jgi:ATP-dependent Clp protease ATP-binding subunit ClpA
MFERFTSEARAATTNASEEARALGHPAVGAGHLLLGVAVGPGRAAATLRAAGATPDALRAALAEEVVVPATRRPDPEALRSLGIELDEVRRRVEDAFGPGALERTRAAGGHAGSTPRFGPDGKKSLELALRVALSLGDRRILAGHVAVGACMSGDGVLERALRRCGTTPDAVSTRLRTVLAKPERATG